MHTLVTILLDWALSISLHSSSVGRSGSRLAANILIESCIYSYDFGPELIMGACYMSSQCAALLICQPPRTF